MVINLSPANVIESTIMYGVVHGIWVTAKWLATRAEKELKREVRRERNRVIRAHIKSGHKDRFRLCAKGDCSSLQSRKPALTLDLQPELLEAD